jgi:CheY-like chemotaxis protein/DNA-binding CsgD family transcriptional regulator
MEYSILVVNDQDADYRVIASYLKLSASKYLVHKASNGKIACNMAFEINPDLIIMDWDMPVMDGIQATMEIKSNENTKDIPIIMLTAVNRTSENLQTAFKAGAIDFVRHPIDKIEFLARVKSVLLLSDYYKQKVRAEKQAKQLIEDNFKHRMHELSLIALNSSKQKNLITNLKKELENIDQNNGQSKLIAIKRMLNSFDDNDEGWLLFKKSFEALFTGYFTRLDTIHPNLTPNEKRLCAYLKANIPSYDIARLLNISMEGIKKNRYRLRKKLKLSTNENLEEYLSGI